MTNKAQMQLQSLLSIQDEAQDSAANLKKLEEARTKFVVQGGDEADFSLPEALATAVGVGWVLGPIGGLLSGLAQGFLGKHEEQSLLDEYLKDHEIMLKTNEIFNNQIDLMTLTADPADMEQLSGWQTMKDMGMSYIAGSPELREKGMEMIAESMSGVNKMSVTNEEQQIKATAYDAQMKRELSKEQQNIVQALHNDYDSQSANYEQTIMQAETARRAIEKGDPISLYAALIMVNKALDPISVVKSEEAKALGNVGTQIDKTLAKLNEWIGTGAPISETQRKELYGLIDTITTTVTRFQGARDIRFQERGIDAGLPEKYVNDFRLAKEMPLFKRQPFERHENQADVITEPVTDVLETIFPFDDDSPSIIAKFKDWYSGSGRETRAKQRQTN